MAGLSSAGSSCFGSSRFGHVIAVFGISLARAAGRSLLSSALFGKNHRGRTGGARTKASFRCSVTGAYASGLLLPIGPTSYGKHQLFGLCLEVYGPFFSVIWGPGVICCNYLLLV